MSYTAEDRQKKIDIFLKVGKDLPVHDLDDYGKEYIDYLGFQRNLIKDNAMKGTDQYMRRFFVFKVAVLNKDKKKDPEFLMDTLFQRYTDDLKAWQICGHYMERTLETSGGTSPWQFQFYIDLLTKGKATISKEIRPGNENHIGRIAILASKEEWKAAKIIQKIWRKIRIDPSYYMCKRVQMRDTMDYGTEFNWKDLKGLFPKWKEKDFREVFPCLFPKN